MIERAPAWVLDASPLINLVATGRSRQIAIATATQLVVVDQAAREVIQNLSGGEPYPLEPLFRDGLLSRAALSAEGSRTFVDLVGDDKDDLGDGEAASIAHAAELGLGVILDDTKARRVCGERFPTVPIVSSIELLRHERIVSALPRDQYVDAIFNALSLARMRVLHDHVDWVVQLLGEERAASCSSLRRRLGHKRE